jgi:NADH-quinone oxidoreductase subunit N
MNSFCGRVSRTRIALTIAGLCFKASIAPFHQWTPDVYEGAPTPVTAFMATATKAAAFAVLLRITDTALISDQLDWGPMLATPASFSIIVGNLGALAQSSLKRILAWSSVAQAGYIMSGVAVATRLGINATAFYLAVYLVMNMAAFAVVIARSGDRPRRRHRLDERDRFDAAVAGMADDAGDARPGRDPATAGFIGKLFLIEASIDGQFTWLGVFIVVGSMISWPTTCGSWRRSGCATRRRRARGGERCAGPAGVGRRRARCACRCCGRSCPPAARGRVRRCALRSADLGDRIVLTPLFDFRARGRGVHDLF